MATRALSADAGRASSEIPEGFATPNRRSLLALVAGAGAVAATAGAAVAAPAPQRPWDRAVARFEHAREAAQQFGDEVYEPAWARLNADAGTAPSLTVEHTARNGQVGRYEVNPRLPDGGWSYPFLRDAASERAAAWNAWKERFREAEKRHKWDDVAARSDRLDEAEYRARKAMMREPAPDMAALAYKLRLALEYDELWDHEREALRFDAERTLA